jgi:hypothetical protein
MENESLGMAMAKLAKLAKTIPPSATTGQERPAFSRFSQNSHSHREELNFPKGQTATAFSQNSRFSHSHPGEINFSNDHQSEPRVTLSQLPERLVNAVRRVCVEIHNDNDAAVQAMMEDLCWSDPRDWNKLIEHFESQLPPPPETALVPVPAVVMPHPVRITRQSSIVAWAWSQVFLRAAGGRIIEKLLEKEYGTL